MKLPSGEVIQGPQPVRDAKHVMGFPWLSAEMKVQLRRSNKMALRGLKRAEENYLGASVGKLAVVFQHCRQTD